MGINAYTDTFKFTTVIFPDVVYTWNPKTKIASWTNDNVTESAIRFAFDLAELPEELYESFKTYMESNTSGCTDYLPNEVQEYVDNGTWKLVN